MTIRKLSTLCRINTLERQCSLRSQSAFGTIWNCNQKQRPISIFNSAVGIVALESNSGNGGGSWELPCPALPWPILLFLMGMTMSICWMKSDWQFLPASHPDKVAGVLLARARGVTCCHFLDLKRWICFRGSIKSTRWTRPVLSWPGRRSRRCLQRRKVERRMSTGVLPLREVAAEVDVLKIDVERRRRGASIK